MNTRQQKIRWDQIAIWNIKHGSVPPAWSKAEPLYFVFLKNYLEEKFQITLQWGCTRFFVVLNNIKFRKVYNGEKHCLTCVGTASASLPGMLLTSRMRSSIDRTDPENTVAKKTFHIVNHNTLLVALISILLCEMYPWMEERNAMTGGTNARNNWRIRLGRYPVITWLTNFL